MTPTTALALAGAVFVLAVTPGPAVASITARTLGAGLGAALWHVAGIAMGDIVLIALACLGMSTLAQHYGEVFLAVKWIGAAYLIWLGIGAFRSDDTPPAELPIRPPTGHHKDALAGLLTTLGNPKPILFYAAFLPTFVDLANITAVDFVLVCAIACSMVFIVLAGYALLAARARRLLRDRRTVRAMNRASGAVLVGTGVVIASRS
ncbi:LysE family translocator [Zoogloeaceae bacterium G21618-S1]|uniref:LysE family translocator n=1 Tax=Denitromonas halophila TaxID=1629404 RepID=A0A557R2G3_9RHOO|nr:LysE family translocator [Denitromonas halophila]MCZ4305675.1 LysE family translocator [Zoogloeaceae bacterium G21618-S1]TVO59343.1 LysE family translocator [Denitromonas halophila]